jgi:hypothetical protein
MYILRILSLLVVLKWIDTAAVRLAAVNNLLDLLVPKWRRCDLATEEKRGAWHNLTVSGELQ